MIRGFPRRHGSYLFCHGASLVEFSDKFVARILTVSYLLYAGIFIYAALLLLIVLSFANLEGGVEEVSSGVVPFVAGIIIILVSFSVVYFMFPSQLSAAYSIGSSSAFSIFSGSNHLSKFSSGTLNYSYPSNMVPIDLNSVASFVSSHIGIGNGLNNSNNSKSIFPNVTMTVLLPYQFIFSMIGNSPSLVGEIKSFNLSKTATGYSKQNTPAGARNYLESKFPPLKDLSVIAVGSQFLNASHSNLSFFKMSPSAFQHYLQGTNFTGFNRTFPVNITGYMLSQIKNNASANNSITAVLPSEILLVNISNHIGFQLGYSQNKIFNLTHLPFSVFSAAFYITNSTLCFTVGTVFPSSMAGSFHAAFSSVEKSMKCRARG